VVIHNKTYPNNEVLKKAHLDYPDVMPLGWEWYNIEQKVLQVGAEIPPKSKLLDVGCNSGGMGIFFRDVCKCKVFGFDISQELAKRAHRKGEKTTCADAEKIPFKDNSFDCVFLGEMIEHSYKPDDILKECKRVLKPFGVLVGTTVDEVDYENRWVKWEDSRLHARPYGTKEIKKLMDKHFVNTKVYTVVTQPDTYRVVWIIFKGGKG
jgi:ubiquinone/menaquinone biosynthesis C-methylase UbiE